MKINDVKNTCNRGNRFYWQSYYFAVIKKGYEVVILDSNINTNPKTIEKIHHICNKNGFTLGINYFFKGDLRDINGIENLFLNSMQ